MNKKKTAFVLSGGGLRGCFQVGALQYLMEEKKIIPDIVCGISTGSLQALGVALGLNLERFWIENIKKKSDVYSDVLSLWNVLPFFGIYLCIFAMCAGIFSLFLTPWLACLIASPVSLILLVLVFIYVILPNLSLKSIYRFSGLRRILEKNLDKQVIENSKVDLFVGTVDLKSSIITYRSKKQITVDDILASCTIPIAFPPVKKDNLESVDGGVRDIAPMRVAIKKGATDIYLVICDLLEPYSYSGKIKNIINVAERTLAIISHEIILNDIEAALKKNKLAPAGKYKKVNLFVIYPDKELVEMMSDVLKVSPEIIARGIANGKKQAKTILNGAPLTLERIEEIIAMTERIEE